MFHINSLTDDFHHNAKFAMKVLVIGGYGAFGARIVKRLKRVQNLEVIVGGRNPAKADVVLNVMHSDELTKRFSELKPHLVIHTAGPFDDTEGYNVARSCLAASDVGHKCNYLDLADNTSYVMGFSILDDEARRRGCLLVTGASTTPAITTSVVSHFCPPFFAHSSLHHGISPGNSLSPPSDLDTLSHIEINLSVANSSMPGEGTVKSVLAYCGDTIRNIQNGQVQNVYGWQSLHSRRFSGMVSSRWCSDVAVPDVDIFTAHLTLPSKRSPYAFPKTITSTQKTLKEFRFRAGVESSISMMSLSLFASLKQKGVIPSTILLANFSPLLLRVNKLLNMFSLFGQGQGKGQGGMTVDMVGSTLKLSSSTPSHIRWALSANADTGPEIPCTPALIITSKLHQIYKYRNAQVSSKSLVEPQYQPGARVCANMISLHDFTDAIQKDRLDIQQYVSCGDFTGVKDAAEKFTDSVGSLSPTYTALDFLSQQHLSDPIVRVHAFGGVISGSLLVTRSPILRLMLLGGSKLSNYRVLVNMSPRQWQGLSSLDNSSSGQGQGCASVTVTNRFFSPVEDDHLLCESLWGGALTLSMQMKALTQLRQRPRVSPNERPWVYTGFESVCLCAWVFGKIPLPACLTPFPHYRTMPHEDGLGWDVVASFSVPMIGTVLTAEGPVRIADVKGDGCGSIKEGSGNIKRIEGQVEAVQATYGVQTDSQFLQKILGKFLLIYDSECVFCDSSVASLMALDKDGLIMFSSSHSRKSAEVLAALGLDEDSFHEQKDQTIFVITPFGKVLTKSEALLSILRALPGAKSLGLRAMLGIVPSFGRDWVYDYMARNRHSLLAGSGSDEGESSATCSPLSSRDPSEQARFL